MEYKTIQEHQGKEYSYLHPFQSKIHHAETLNVSMVNTTMFVCKEPGKWNVRFGVTSKVCEIRY